MSTLLKLAVAWITLMSCKSTAEPEPIIVLSALRTTTTLQRCASPAGVRLPVSIDRLTASCADYDACESRGSCTHSYSNCIDGVAMVEREGAVEFCTSRGMRVQNHREWETAMLGLTAALPPWGMRWWMEDFCPSEVEYVGSSHCKYTTPTGTVWELFPFVGEWVDGAECEGGEIVGMMTSIRRIDVAWDELEPPDYLKHPNRTSAADHQIRCVKDAPIHDPVDANASE